MSREAAIRITKLGASLEIVFTSPETGNKLTRPLLAGMEKALRETDEDIRAVVVRNEGCVFCKGENWGISAGRMPGMSARLATA
jgi:enoyl-CoA hydratase/carnithine racemase